MLVAQLAYTYFPPMNRVLHSEPIDAWWWAVFTGAGFAIFAVAEVKKLVAGARRSAKARARVS
jgi:hypothetical protein